MSLRACDDRVLVPAIRANSFAAWHAGYATVLPYCERISMVIVFMLSPYAMNSGLEVTPCATAIAIISFWDFVVLAARIRPDKARAR
jgi:hypothetical protein